jgi:hypothetical protein
MSNRRKPRTRVEACDRPACTGPVTHVLVDPAGDCVRSCDRCWPALVVAIESLGGSVGACSCPVCFGIPARGLRGGRGGAPNRADPSATLKAPV